MCLPNDDFMTQPVNPPVYFNPTTYYLNLKQQRAKVKFKLISVTLGYFRKQNASYAQFNVFRQCELGLPKKTLLRAHDEYASEFKSSPHSPTIFFNKKRNRHNFLELLPIFLCVQFSCFEFYFPLRPKVLAEKKKPRLFYRRKN